MKKVCILFGAGADAPYGIETGGGFAENVLGTSTEYGAKMNDAIKQHYLHIIPKDDDWYPSYNTYRNWKDDDLVKASLRKRYLEEKQKISDERFEEKFISLNSEDREKLKGAFPSYMGILDGKFSTLISPSILGRGKFWQVVSCYCRAYLTIVQQVLGSDEYESFLSPSNELIAEIRDASKKEATKTTYYSIIKKLKPSLDISVVTTNYTYYCEELSGIHRDKITYVHGRIGLFESPKNLCVYDLDSQRANDINKEIVFPYLFIQSGVKPIVERKQIEEYAKMIRFMDEADKIIILGYRLNCDDNHINSIVRSSVNKGKEVAYLSYNDGGDGFLERKAILDRLRLSSPSANLKWKEITSRNAVDVFENELLS